jgi:hypothetical protein
MLWRKSFQVQRTPSPPVRNACIRGFLGVLHDAALRRKGRQVVAPGPAETAPGVTIDGGRQRSGIPRPRIRQTAPPLKSYSTDEDD